MNCNYKVKITDIQTKYKFKVFCTGYDDSEIKEKIDAMYEAWPKASGEGETPTLDNTANATMTLDLKGNTSQVTTTGKNLLPINKIQTQTINQLTITNLGDGTIKVNGTSNATTRLDVTYTQTLKANTTYIFSNANTRGSGANVNIQDSSNNVLSNITLNSSTATYTPTTNVTIALMRFYIDSGQTFNDYILKVQLEEGSTATGFEPYTNGASPNPDYPQDVHVVTGDNTIKVEGKNYCNGINQDIFLNNAVNQCGISSGNSGLYIPVTSNTYTISTKITQTRYRVACSKNIPTPVSQTVYRGVNKDGTSNSITIDTTGYDYLIVNATDLTAIQIEKGSEATEYAPYQSQSYAVNLGTMELCKIGDYQDYIYKEGKKWYKYGAIGKVILDGSEEYSLSAGNKLTLLKNIGLIAVGINNTGYLYCDNYKEVANNDSDNTNYNISRFYATGTYNYEKIVFRNVDISTANDFKTWLSTHNTIVYYPLVTPTTTEITDTTLISQLNTLAEAESYSGQTNISQTNDDKPFIITAKALKDLSNL